MATIIAHTVAHASNSSFAEAIARFWRGARDWHRRRRSLKEARAAFMHMVYLEDRLLDDMGATREDVLFAASLPIEENAALALQARTARRRATTKLSPGRRCGGTM